MKTSPKTALLAGALAASFALHLSGLFGRVPAGTPECVLPASLELTPRQTALLREACGDCCSQSCDVSAKAAAKLSELKTALSDNAPTGHVRQLAADLAQLRSERLKQCVETILRVRGVLDPQQIRALQDCCWKR